ncbi:MAG: hypothetical protein IKP28_06740 [Clostridia bacterium]|nr:hypothetical protein [Clostridia bacterium]
MRYFNSISGRDVMRFICIEMATERKEKKERAEKLISVSHTVQSNPTRLVDYHPRLLLTHVRRA